MRLRSAALVACCALLAPPACAGQDQTFPYTAYVTTDDVYVRCGPGRNYYPTDKLRAGDEVEVYRHDPGGWYAIRPVEGCFSWVAGRYLELGDDGLATVTGDRVAARVGSGFSDIRDVIQVRLDRGEVVEVLGKKHFGSQPEEGVWYKIAPPSGEFRWVFGKYVDPDYHHSGVREAPGDASPLVQRPRASAEHVATSATSPATEPKEKQAIEDIAGAVRTAEHWTISTAKTAQRPEAASTDAFPSDSPEPRGQESETPIQRMSQSAAPADDSSGTESSRRIAPERFQAELQDIDMELSIMLAEEPTVWNFDELVIRARALLTKAETALDRGHARLLANKIDWSQDVKRRYDAVNSAATAAERQDRRLVDLRPIRDSGGEQLASKGRFDGAGRLARVVSSKLGAPRYALLDEKGDVTSYVTPAPGVNMSYYVGQRIGVNGIRGYIAEHRAQHVTAKHITALEERRR